MVVSSTGALTSICGAFWGLLRCGGFGCRDFHKAHHSQILGSIVSAAKMAKSVIEEHGEPNKGLNGEGLLV